MILIDTGPLVGLINPADQHHERAIREFGLIAAQRMALSEAVLTEAHYFVRSPARRARLAAFLREQGVQAYPARNDFAHWQQVGAWMAKYTDQDPDYSDALLAVLCDTNKRLSIWTFDQEFATIWRTPSGRPIPLALPIR